MRTRGPRQIAPNPETSSEGVPNLGLVTHVYLSLAEMHIAAILHRATLTSLDNCASRQSACATSLDSCYNLKVKQDDTSHVVSLERIR